MKLLILTISLLCTFNGFGQFEKIALSLVSENDSCILVQESETSLFLVMQKKNFKLNVESKIQINGQHILKCVEVNSNVKMDVVFESSLTDISVGGYSYKAVSELDQAFKVGSYIAKNFYLFEKVSSECTVDGYRRPIILHTYENVYYDGTHEIVKYL